MTKSERAEELFNSGLNCAQAVFAAFCEEYGIDKETALKMTAGMGRGFRSGEICGAAAGAVMVIGLKHGDDKRMCAAKTDAFLNEFKNANNSIVCRELLEIRAENKRKCIDLVMSAADILEYLL